MISGKNKVVLASGDELLALIPQRQPMVMIDKLLFSNSQQTTTGFKIEPTCIFCENGFLSESGLVENIAQTAAAGVGYICKKENRPIPIGYIAAIKNLEIVNLPTLGSDLETEVYIVNQVLNVTIVNGKVFCNGEVFANCEMKIFIKQD